MRILGAMRDAGGAVKGIVSYKDAVEGVGKRGQKWRRSGSGEVDR
jgi:hypothetical protein